MRPGAVAVLLLVAACQPQARRALVLDLALSDPALLDGTAEPWRDAGYTVEYRRFYPHLTESDLTRYRVLLFLLGRGPEIPSDALTAGDLGLLNEWVQRAGVVVLGYAGDGEGSLDRWTANRWLASQGAGIAISDRTLQDSAARALFPRAQPWAMGRPVGDDPLGAGYDPFPLDRNHALSVRRIAQVLASVNVISVARPAKGPAPAPRPGAPIAAATRLGDGLVVVLSRHALGALAPQYRPTTMPLLQPAAMEETRHFLTALARWTRRPAEWAHVPPAERPEPLALAGAPAAVELQPAPNTVPPGVTVVQLAQGARGKADSPPDLPNWIRQVGIRALWTPLVTSSDQGHEIARSAASFDSLVGSLDAAGLNLLAGDAHPETVVDSTHHLWADRDVVRRSWKEVVNHLQPTSVAWIPTFDYSDYRPPGTWADSSHGARGEAVAMPCALDSLMWDAGVAPAYMALARLASQTRQLVPALAFDLSGPRKGGWSGYSMGQEFCDAAWRQGLARIKRRGLDTVAISDRYRTLREAGLLPAYFGALEDLIAERARGLRDRALKESGTLYFALRLQQAPGDWFTLGLARGFALADRPLLLFTPEAETRTLLAAYRARGLNAVHAVELPLALVRAGSLSGLKRLAFGHNDGFWLSTGEGASARARSATGRWRSDSIAVLLRRLTR
jgi:hypothetical protein